MHGRESIVPRTGHQTGPASTPGVAKPLYSPLLLFTRLDRKAALLHRNLSLT